MGGIFVTPLGALWVSNGVAQGLTHAWLTLARRSHTPSSVDTTLLSFLEERVVLAEAPGMGGFDVTEPPLDAVHHRRQFAVLNAELAKHLTAPEFDGGLIGAPWAELEEYWRCRWLAPVEALHLGIYASLGETPPPLQWQLDARQRSALDVLHLEQLKVNGVEPLGGEEELLLRTRMTEGVLAAGGIFPQEIAERLFLRRAQLEEHLGYPGAAAATWRALMPLLSTEEQRAVAEDIARALESAVKR